MKYLPPFVVHNTFELKNSQDISVYKELYGKVIASLRDGDIDINSVSKFKYINDYFLDQFE
jgi:hypothetical protein